MDINDYTYEHQIIRQANYLINNLSGNSINNVQLNPKGLFSIKIFAYIEQKTINIDDLPRFQELGAIINNFIESKLTPKELSDYINYLKHSLNEINSDGSSLTDILDQIEFLIILKYLSNSFNFIDKELIKNLLDKLKSIGNHQDYVCLFNLYNNTNDMAIFPSEPLSNISLESLIELKLNEIISNTDSELYKKLKNRKFLFIKDVYNRLNLLSNDNILKPSRDLIYSIVLAATILKLLEYDNIISLNKDESIDYIDKELGSQMIEKEINDKVEKIRNEIITFDVGLLKKYMWTSKITLFIALFIYFVLWILLSSFLYFRIFQGYWKYIFGILFAYSLYLLEQSYIKSYKKNK